MYISRMFFFKNPSNSLLKFTCVKFKMNNLSLQEKIIVVFDCICNSFKQIYFKGLINNKLTDHNFDNCSF